jgi:hypothetical protein
MSATDRFADEEPGLGKPWAIICSRLLKASVLVAVATFIGVPILSPENPVLLLAALTASQADEPTLQPATDESKPTVQSAHAAEASPPIAEGPTRDEIAAALRSSHQSQLEKENREHEAALFREFQAWVAEKDAKAQVRVQQDAPAAVVPTSLRPMKKNLRKVRSARAEIRAMRHTRKQVRREQNGPTQVSTSQDQTVQNPQPRSLLQILGFE